jgi:hypothetical protein
LTVCPGCGTILVAFGTIVVYVLPSGFVNVTLFLPRPGPPFFFGGGLFRTRVGATGPEGTKLINPSSSAVPRPSIVVPGPGG